MNDGVQDPEAEETTSKGESKKKKGKGKKKSPVVVVHDPNNPLEQVANAIRRRNEALNAPPAGLVNLCTTLPSGWEKATDQSTGKVYYFNRSTGKQQWDPPADELPEGWKSSADAKSGKLYYYHTNGETRWVKPTV